MRSSPVAFALLSLAVATPGAAVAGPWITAEVPAAVPVSDPQAEAFRGGTLPAIGVYGRLSPHVALGMRARAGVLADATSTRDPTTGLAEPGWGGLGTLSFAVRTGISRGWIEATAGGGVTGSDVVPVFEVGAGWMSRVGAVEIGPSVRFLHVRAGGDGPGLGSADLALVGFELRRAPARRVAHPLARVEHVRVTPDSDRIVDLAGGCADDPSACETPVSDNETIIDVLETCNVLSEALGDEAGDGCTEGGPVEVAADRIILAEHVLFAFDRARVRHAARPVLRAIADAWRREGWNHVVIEGHADVRGDADYNMRLSQLRAERARAVLVEAGIPADAIEAIGRGATQPRSPNHDLNRRVEFIIVPRTVTTEVQP